MNKGYCTFGDADGDRVFSTRRGMPHFVKRVRGIDKPPGEGEPSDFVKKLLAQ